jgi:hypothetical protein
MSSEKVRENRLRRMAQRQGLRLLKSRRRDPNARDYGGFALIKPDGNSAEHGFDPWPYSATLDEIEEVLKRRGAEKRF